MSRIIKFRVWDNVDYMSNPFTLQDLMLKKIQFASECPVMQFTGLKDKKGIEIYEDDIIEVNWDDARYKVTKHLVEWSNTYAKFEFPGGCPHNDSIHFEVIGNIYESAELLNQK